MLLGDMVCLTHKISDKLLFVFCAGLSFVAVAKLADSKSTAGLPDRQGFLLHGALGHQRRAHATKLGAPLVKGRRVDTQLTTDIWNAKT
jgi:hypothetical protein